VFVIPEDKILPLETLVRFQAISWFDEETKALKYSLWLNHERISPYVTNQGVFSGYLVPLIGTLNYEIKISDENGHTVSMPILIKLESTVPFTINELDDKLTVFLRFGRLALQETA
jgi:hypothetical protein